MHFIHLYCRIHSATTIKVVVIDEESEKMEEFTTSCRELICEDTYNKYGFYIVSYFEAVEKNILRVHLIKERELVCSEK